MTYISALPQVPECSGCKSDRPTYPVTICTNLPLLQESPKMHFLPFAPLDMFSPAVFFTAYTKHLNSPFELKLDAVTCVKY